MHVRAGQLTLLLLFEEYPVTGLTEQNRSLVFAEVQKQPYATRFAKEEINQALASAVDIFFDFEQTFAPGFCAVKLRSAGGQRPADFALELIPALVYAHRFFGDSLPEGLNEKLRNQPQTHDTLLELWCLGAFEPHHKVQYEPRLADGKVPDLMLSLPGGQAVYVECKSQNFMDSKHQRLFHKATGRIYQILSRQSSAFIEKAWAKGLRSEVRLSQSPSHADLKELEQTLDEHEPRAGIPPIAFGRSITLSLVLRDQPFDERQPPPSAVILVGTGPSIMHHRNAHAAVYPWPRLDNIRRKSQRRLLGDARRKLRSIPATAYGLICIQTVSSKGFTPDIHLLLRQKEFERIPIVWLNPVGVGRVIWRDDALLLRDQVFGAIEMRAKENADRWNQHQGAGKPWRQISGREGKLKPGLM